jgi:Asp-tRNA(Asn)/Glu-tRNA(Gln) amidotransferase A subunit family amidase
MSTSEATLLKRFRDAKVLKKRSEELFENAKKELANVEAELIDVLLAQDKTATATYEGIGSAQLGTPALYASCKVENREMLFDYLRTEKRDDLIKTNVNDKSLSSFVKELIENGKTPPPFVSYYLKPKLKLKD